MMSLKLQNLKKHFQQGNQTITPLRGLNLEVHPGEILAIVGSSGSGKTTLFHLISGLMEPSEGTLFLNQIPWHQWSVEQKAHWRSQHMGIVFQNHMLVPHLNALENVQLPLEILGQDPKQAQVEAAKILTEVGLAERQYHYPEQLSGGEAQRVALARALVKAPPLLLADEPTGQLDTETAQSVLKLMLLLFKKSGTTALIITHDPAIAAQCDRIFTLSSAPS